VIVIRVATAPRPSASRQAAHTLANAGHVRHTGGGVCVVQSVPSPWVSLTQKPDTENMTYATAAQSTPLPQSLPASVVGAAGAPKAEPPWLPGATGAG
jgi:hypothetical protein